MVLIRDAQSGDASAIARVQVGSWQSTYAGMLPDRYLAGMSARSAEVRWRMALPDRGPGCGTVVAIDEAGDLVGFCSFGPQRRGIDGFSGEVYALYLLDDAKGQGIGRLLMAAGAERMLEGGVRSALVWCLGTNPTRWFYERLGGARVADRPGRFAGVPIMEVAYGWRDLVPLARQSAVG
ncbi:N-acetyltransferase family protein [Azospirillum sp. sgz301742]